MYRLKPVQNQSIKRRESVHFHFPYLQLIHVFNHYKLSHINDEKGSIRLYENMRTWSLPSESLVELEHGG